MQEAAWLNQLLADALCKCFYCQGTVCFRACTEDGALPVSEPGACPRPARCWGVRAEPRVPGTSCGALTLEVSKSPTARGWRAQLPTVHRPAIFAFDSPSSCSWSPNRTHLETGANMVSRTKERALDLLSVHICISAYICRVV